MVIFLKEAHHFSLYQFHATGETFTEIKAEIVILDLNYV